MFRGLERAENTARLIEAGFRIALTRSNDPETEWKSVIVTSAQQDAYQKKHDSYDSKRVAEFLLRDPDNPSSVRLTMKAARDNARLVRTALTTEVWSAVNESWMLLENLLKEPVAEADLPAVLDTIRKQSALVRGALYGTMLRNDIFDFCRLGMFIERADNTARILDVKYHALLPSPSFVGGRMDKAQWEMILRSVSAHRSFRWAGDWDYNASNIANFLILDRRMPRSLAFCAKHIVENLTYLANAYGGESPSMELAKELESQLSRRDINSIIDDGLHEFLGIALSSTAALGRKIEQEYRFNV